MRRAPAQFLLVEPVAKTPYPPLGLMKIGAMLRHQYKGSQVFPIVGTDVPSRVRNPRAIYLTSLFTWDLPKVARAVQFYKDRFPRSRVFIGGIAATLLPDYVSTRTGIAPHVGLLREAEKYSPDYSLTFGRRLHSSITFASRGCPRQCRFCCVKEHEPRFYGRDDWEKDVAPELPGIVFWDNNWLASKNFAKDCEKIRRLGKKVDFNQGLDARLYDENVARELATVDIDPIRFAFDHSSHQSKVLHAISLAKKYSGKEIRIYVLYNFEDSPEDFYHRISVLNKHGVLAFPMEYRMPCASQTRFPGKHWNVALLRALKLSLIFYYRRGMITQSHDSFHSIYGRTPRQFVSKLYEIFEYDKRLKR